MFPQRQHQVRQRGERQRALRLDPAKLEHPGGGRPGAGHPGGIPQQRGLPHPGFTPQNEGGSALRHGREQAVEETTLLFPAYQWMHTGRVVDGGLCPFHDNRPSPVTPLSTNIILP